MIAPDDMRAGTQEGRQQFFFEKRTKKLLDIGVRLPDRDAAEMQELFASFFEKQVVLTLRHDPDRAVKRRQ
jgi:hypothetical protein